MSSPEIQFCEYQNLSRLNEMLTFCEILVISTLRRQAIHLNYLSSIILKLVPRKRRKRKSGANEGKVVIRLVRDQSSNNKT